MQAPTNPPPTLRLGPIAIALGVACVLAWGYLLSMAWGMAHMDAGADMAIMPRMVSWQADDLALVFAMWTIMMAAMMLPSAAPMILMFGALGRQMKEPRPRTDVVAFVGGYLAVWAAYSLAATLAQWALLEARLVSPMMEASSPLLGGALLVAAGIYQFSPVKRACLANCRSPFAFLVAHWRKGSRGAWLMGLRHGLDCLGCCWLLMLLLFVLGVMNVFWIAALAAFVLLEKILPDTRWFSAASGAGFVAWGLVVLAGLHPFG